MRRVRDHTPGWAFPSRGGSSRSTPAGSSPAKRRLAARPFSWTCLSYVLLKRGRHARRMFDIAPDHAIGIYAGLLALPLALLRLRRANQPATILGASVLMAVTGAIHLGLVFTHFDETVTAVLFVLNGVAYIALSQMYTWRWWRPASAALITATLLGYV